jgi:uncharacterized membrane protein
MSSFIGLGIFIVGLGVFLYFQLKDKDHEIIH